jgi:hypothetical protein
MKGLVQEELDRKAWTVSRRDGEVEPGHSRLRRRRCPPSRDPEVSLSGERMGPPRRPETTPGRDGRDVGGETVRLAWFVMIVG